MITPVMIIIVLDYHEKTRYYCKHDVFSDLRCWLITVLALGSWDCDLRKLGFSKGPPEPVDSRNPLISGTAPLILMLLVGGDWNMFYDVPSRWGISSSQLTSSITF